MTTTKLTKRQNEILSLIQSHIAKTGSPPTRAEIAKTMGFKSPNAAEDHLRALAKKGAIELVPGTSRGIRLPKSGVPLVNIRVGKQPLLTEEQIKEYTRVEKNLFHPRIDFLIQATSAEYQSLNILNGDFVAVQQTEKLENGQLAVVRHNQELSIKRFSAELLNQPLTIEGRVVGVIRSLTSPNLS